MNLTKNNETYTAIDSKTGKPVYTKPDAIDETTVYEVNDTKEVYNTSQSEHKERWLSN